MRRIALALLLAACRASETKPDDTDTDAEVVGDDEDGDGFTPSEGDCDEGDGNVYPGATEACDGFDNDCDGEIDEGVGGTFYVDADGDGYGDEATAYEACEGDIQVAGDCDDADADVNPDAVEICNGLDDNCDGAVDEELLGTWYADADGDGHGDPDVPVEACEAPEGVADAGDDCDDTTALAFPGNEEVCDEVDNDCDGTVDEDVQTTWYVDLDGDGYGDAGLTQLACALPTGYSPNADDCDDETAFVNPAATEACNTVDDDCDGTVDEPDAVDAPTWYTDGDGDGAGDPAAGTVACNAPDGTVAAATDCNDADASLHPGTTWYIDYDADGYGSSTYTLAQCEAPDGYVRNAGDCDDARAASNPDGVEECGGADEDCDGLVDDADPDVTGTSPWYDDLDGDGVGDIFSVATEACEAPEGTSSLAEDCDDADPDALACESCAEILDLGLSTGDGLYTIDPLSGAPFDAYCDMTTSGGGWTLLAVNGAGSYWTSSTVLSDAESGDPSLTDDHKSDAWSTLPFTDLLFEDGALWAEYDDVGDGAEDYYTFQAAIPVHNCGTRSGYAWEMSAGTLSGGALCNTTLYMHPIDWDGGANATCSATYVYANNSYGPTWSTGNNNGCPLDDPSGSAFYSGAGNTPWGDTIRMWAR